MSDPGMKDQYGSHKVKPSTKDRDPELKTTRGVTKNPTKEEDTPMSTPV